MGCQTDFKAGESTNETQTTTYTLLTTSDSATWRAIMVAALINLTGNLISAGANSPLTFSDEQFNEGDVQVYTQPGFLATKNQLYLPIITR